MKVIKFIQPVVRHIICNKPLQPREVCPWMTEGLAKHSAEGEGWVWDHLDVHNSVHGPVCECMCVPGLAHRSVAVSLEVMENCSSALKLPWRAEFLLLPQFKTKKQSDHHSAVM